MTFTSCNLGGIVFSGVLYVTLSSYVANNYTATINGAAICAWRGGSTCP